MLIYEAADELPPGGARRPRTAAGPDRRARRAGRRRLERDGRLAGYRYLPATKADLLHRLGRDAEAADAYQAALALSDNAAEQAFLTERVRRCAADVRRP